MEAVVNRVTTIFDGDATPIKAASQQAQQGLNGFNRALSKSGTFATKLARIIEYRLIRGGISKIIQGLGEGKKAIEAYDKAFIALTGRSSASNASALMREMAENATLLKNTFASLFMTIRASLGPAINMLVDALRDAMNTVNQFISALMGRTSYTKAVKGVNAVSNAVAALKKQIFGFDELNILNAPSGSGGEDYSKYFEEANISALITNFAKPFRAIIDAIDWDKTFELVRKIGEQLALWAVPLTLMHFITKLAGLPVALAALKTFTIGAVVTIAGVVGLQDAIQEALEEGFSGKSLGKMLVSSGLIMMGGTLIGKAFGSAVLGGAISAITIGAVMIWEGLKGAFTDALSPLEGLLIASGTAIIGAAIGSLFGPMGTALGALIGFGVGLFGDFIIGMVQRWDEFKEANAAAWEALKAGFGSFVMDLKLYWMQFTDTTAAVWEALKASFQALTMDLKLNWEKTVASLSELWQKLKDAADKFFQPIVTLIEKVKGGWENVKGFFSGNVTIPTYANGGFPSTGDLFIANEAGPELVGSFGNRTSVYNQEQFGAAMAAANQEVVNAVLSIGQQIAGAVNAKPVPTFKLGDREIAAAAERGTTLTGARLIQGGAR